MVNADWRRLILEKLRCKNLKSGKGEKGRQLPCAAYVVHVLCVCCFRVVSCVLCTFVVFGVHVMCICSRC